MIKEIVYSKLRRGMTSYYVLICDKCNKEFTRKHSKATRYKHHFCCRECRYKWYVGKNNVNYGKPILEKARKAIIKANTGRRAWNFKGRKLCRGYILIYKPEHPNATGKNHKYILEHRLVMEKVIGRYLYPYEVVHHINGIKDDNRPENLELLPNNSVHNKQVQEVYLENTKLKKEIEELKIKLENYENNHK